MPQVTIKQLQEQLESSNKIRDMLQENISMLNKELDDTRNNLNVVSSIELKVVADTLQTSRKLNKVLEDRISSLEKIVENQREEIDRLKSAEIKTEHNSRGAGRKQFKDADTVKKIFKLYESGDSLQSIANKLNEANIKTNRGGTWAKSSVRFILQNKAYLEQSIIDEKMFNNISERLKSNRKEKKILTEEEYNQKREQINSLRKGLREQGHKHSLTEALPSYEEYLKNPDIL